jgi:hypothetical protein
MSEEISSRVAECTRLILVKDGFGEDLGALDRWANERRKDTRILEWFGPPERNTLRPLVCVLLEPEMCIMNVSSIECTLPFIVQGRCLH